MLFESAFSRATTVTQLTSPTVSIRSRPENLNELDRHLFEPLVKQNLFSSQMLELDNVTAYSTGWLYKNITLLKESFVDVRQPSRSRRLGNLPRNLLSALAADKLDSAVWVTDNWSLNYYHWLTDAMPRLYVATQYRPESELLLPAPFRSIGYREQSLQPFRIKATHVLKENRCARIRKLFLPTYVAKTGYCNDGIIRDVGELYRAYFGVSHSSGRRIYVSRSKALVRQISNEAEILPILNRYGFEIVHCEDLSFSEQVRLFSDSAIVVGPHGAGLVNIMFMQQGAKVLEIHPQYKKIRTNFFSIASAFNHSYFYILANTASKTLDYRLANMIVNPGELEEQLERACRT